MLWINFLHLYQPANIEKEKIEEATRMSYERIIRALEEHPNLHFTFNISGCLLERLSEDSQFDHVFSRIKNLISKGQLELVGSAAYHALLPLVGVDEARKQIKEQEEIIKKHFGDIKLRGFFFPEMALNRELVNLVKELGYGWIIADEISAYGSLGKVDFSKKYIDKPSGLEVLFRNRKVSESYVPETIMKLIEKDADSLAVTGSDAELYGLRHIDHLAEFEKLIKYENIASMTISEYMSQLQTVIELELMDSNWQSEEKELKKQQPFILWHNQRNRIQVKLLEFVRFVQEQNDKYKNDENAAWARWHLVRGLASCVFWWASGKNFKKVFGPISWNPDEVERGLNELIRSIRALEKSTDLATKLEAEKKLSYIRNLLWQKHWKQKK